MSKQPAEDDVDQGEEEEEKEEEEEIDEEQVADYCAMLDRLGNFPVSDDTRREGGRHDWCLFIGYTIKNFF
jgi:hypothetical protein